MTITIVTVDGQKTSAGAAAALVRLKSAFKSRFGVSLVLTSGYRSHAEQVAIFKARYRVQSSGNGPYGDVRWWNGQRWVRHSSAGTVAQPGTSRHEKASAVDLRDTGRDAGVTVRGTTRANWLRANGPRYGFQPTGYGFGEPWHYDYTGSHAAPSGGGGSVPSPAPAPAPKPTPEKVKEGDEEMPLSFINVQGKAKSHQAGLFAVMRSNSGILFAKRVTTGSTDPDYPTISHTQLPAWEKTMVFHELR